MSITTINAYAVKHRGGRAEPFSYQRTLSDRDVLVRITHASVARGDVQFIDDAWGDTKFPLVPGHEIVGVVEQADAVTTGLIAGDRVGVGYQLAACFSCELCLSGREQLCPAQEVIGVHAYGGAADHIAVDYRFVFKLPPAIDSAGATPLLSSGLTVYSAIAAAQLTERAEVAVLGVGGLGHLALQFLGKMGHRVSAFSHSPEKRAAIERWGAEYIDSSHVEETGVRNRFDFILSTANARFDLNTYLRALRPRGRLCFVAQPLEPLSINVGLLYDTAQRTVCGHYVGSRADMSAMLAFAAEHGIRSDVHLVPFANVNDVNEAIDTVRNRTTPARVVLQR
jgi:D-arabinose 1-dehydrogenase-like Zn-dependent alcohol dehydrogenase